MTWPSDELWKIAADRAKEQGQRFFSVEPEDILAWLDDQRERELRSELERLKAKVLNPRGRATADIWVDPVPGWTERIEAVEKLLAERPDRRAK